MLSRVRSVPGRLVPRHHSLLQAAQNSVEMLHERAKPGFPVPSQDSVFCPNAGVRKGTMTVPNLTSERDEKDLFRTGEVRKRSYVVSERSNIIIF